MIDLDGFKELLRRALDETRLGDPVPRVSTEVASLTADPLAELYLCVLELERLRP